MKKIILIKVFPFLTYYLLILVGLIATSWIIWSRFIRTRTIREIPDYLLTEYRFWILLYICCVYLYVIKNLLKPSESNPIFTLLMDQIYKPFTVLDRFIKYNKYTKVYYHEIILLFIKLIKKIEAYHILGFILFMRIIPRIILVTFLLLDTFYFHKLEIFYKVVLIGILPFIFRYLKYSIKDMYEYYVEEIEHHYSEVTVYEKGYEGLISRKRKTEAIHHFTIVSIKEYIDIKYENELYYLFKEVTYQYIGRPFSHEHFYKEYRRIKYNDSITKLTYHDYQEMNKLFYKLIPIIIELKSCLFKIRIEEEEIIMKWSKVLIFSMYLICWGYILVISYYYYPVELSGFKYLVRNVMRYLCNYDNYFTGVDQYSLNKNLITKESLKYIAEKILNKVIK